MLTAGGKQRGSWLVLWADINIVTKESIMDLVKSFSFKSVSIYHNKHRSL